MKRFCSIFKFEFTNYACSKGFIALTAALIIIMGIALFLPRIIEAFDNDEPASPEPGISAEVTPEPDESGEVGEPVGDRIAIAGLTDAAQLSFFEMLPLGASPVMADLDRAALEQAVQEGEYEAAIIITDDLSYTYIVKNTGMYDSTQELITSAMLSRYQAIKLAALGADETQIAEFLSAGVATEVVRVEGGKDQMSNFFYTYILIFALYMVILLYGQYVASSVANEKSTRAMELLITAAEPRELLFGKVFGTGCAGLLQFVLIFGSGFAFYQMNKSYYADVAIIQSIFNMPLSILLYAFLFLVLGFFLYAFLYGALGSMVSRLEQLNTAVMPVTFLFLIAFMIVVFSMSSGSVDSALMKVASFVPFTSPMAMFTRLAMGTVAAWEIVLSVALLAASVIGTGFLGAAIYRMGVLMYGQPPKPKELLAMLREKKQQSA